MRGRTDAAAKTLGALATAAITAVGLEKFSDVFPFATDHFGSWVAVVATVGGFVALAVAIGLFIARLWWSNRPLSAYEARGWRLNAIAEQLGSGDPLKARLTAQAATITAEVSATESRAVLNVVRSRSARVLGASRIWRLPALFVAAVLALGLGSDYLASERADRVATAKACAEAQEAITAQDLSADGLLPRLCGPSNAGPRPEPSTPDRLSQAAISLAALADQYQDCVTAAVETGDSDARACDDILALIRTVRRWPAAVRIGWSTGNARR